jgi:arylsulfatase
MLPRSNRKRWLSRILLAAGVIFVGLQIINYARLDTQGLQNGTNELVERAVAISNKAMPEYQDLVLATLPPNPNNGAFYRLDDNLPAATATAIPSAEQQHAVSEFEFQLEFEGDAEPTLVTAAGVPVELRDGLLVVEYRTGDYLVNDKPLSIPLANISDIVLRVRADRGSRFQLNWAAEGNEDGLYNNKVSLDLIADGEFHTYIVNAKNAFSRGVEADENISLLGITPSNVDGAIVEIDFVRIVSKQWKYHLTKVGTSYETVDGEGRPVLHLVPNQQLEYQVEVPVDAPVLSLGAALLIDNPPIEVSVAVKTDAETSRIYSTAGLDASHWQDTVVDLAAWAGQTIQLQLRTEGSGDNVVFLSNPMIRSAPKRRFNVIMILEDALRADHLSTHGYARDTAPERTRFMKENGVVFLNAHSQATKTRPSIPSLMTSLYPSATGVWNFSDALSDRYLTLAEIMRAQGYATGSFIQNGNAGPYAGVHQGFSSLRDKSSIGKTTEGLFGEHLQDWLDQNGDRNFFLYLHAIDPHGIYDPPPPYDNWYREAPAASLVGKQPLPKTDSIDPAWAETPSGEARRLLYDGEIRHNDSVIDSFIKTLEQRGLLEDTLLVFVSDHGEWMGEGGRWDHHPPGNRPVIHVPLMLSYPRGLGDPQRLETSVQLIDAMPTILELAAVDASDLLMQGDSLLSLIKGDSPERWAGRVTVSEEPMTMKRSEDPCACGSLFYGPLQLHGSLLSWPHRLKSTFIKSSVYRFREDGITPVASYLPDLYTRYVRQKTLSDLASANMMTWRKLTEGQQNDVYKMDPATLEELRGLGYVN